MELTNQQRQAADILDEDNSGSGRCSVPGACCFASEAAHQRAADQVSLDGEGVVDGCMSGEKTLS
jgi:hypothetical protein